MMNDNISEYNVRIEWVDIAKAICMICVVITHCSYCNNYIRAIFEPFFLTTFFFLSGYVYKNKYNFKQLLIKKAKTILFPWLFFGIINIVLSQILSFNKHTSLINEIICMFLQIRGNSDVLWFLACLFITFIPFYFFSKHLNKSSFFIAFLLSVISVLYCKYIKISTPFYENNALPWHIQMVFIANFFMMLGYYYKNYNIIADKYIQNKVLIILGLIYIIIIYVNLIFFGNIVSLSCYDANIFIWYFLNVLGITIIIEISKRIKANKFFSFIGSNTILIFCMHGKVLSVLESIFRHISLNNKLCNYIYLACIVILTFIILVVPIKVVLKYFPFIIGKRKQKERGI